MEGYVLTYGHDRCRRSRGPAGSNAVRKQRQPTNKKEGCDRGHRPHPLMLPILFYVVRTVCVASSKQQQLGSRSNPQISCGS